MVPLAAFLTVSPNSLEAVAGSTNFKRMHKLAKSRVNWHALT
jgi:hypothetical protein